MLIRAWSYGHSLGGLTTYCESLLIQAEDRGLNEKIIEIHEEYAALVVRAFILLRSWCLIIYLCKNSILWSTWSQTKEKVFFGPAPADATLARNFGKKEGLYGSYEPCIFSLGSWLNYVPNCDGLPCFESLPLSSQTLFRTFHFHPFILQEFVMNSQIDQEHCIGAARIMGSIVVQV